MTFRDVLPLEPDEKGVIVINIDGTHRRFVKAKLIEYLEKETGDLAINQVVRPPKKKGRPRTPKILIKKKVKGEWKRMAVVAILPDGTEHHYVSHSEAARSLNIAKSGINKCIAGKYEKIRGIKFKRAE